MMMSLRSGLHWRMHGRRRVSFRSPKRFCSRTALQRDFRPANEETIEVKGIFAEDPSTANFLDGKSSADTTGVEDKSYVRVDKIDDDLYKSVELWTPPGAKGVFGGQVIGQAMESAWHTVSEGFHVNSMHCYFLRPGNPHKPIIYHVNRSRDGRTFQSRTIDAVQGGKSIFTASLSFQVMEAGLDHQSTIPQNLPPPESLPSHDEIMDKLSKDSRVSPGYKKVIEDFKRFPFPVEVRYVNPTNIFNPKAQPGHALMYMRSKEPLGNLSHVHRSVAAYMSDWGAGVVGLRPHGIAFPSKKLANVTSLDHTMYVSLTHEENPCNTDIPPFRF